MERSATRRRHNRTAGQGQAIFRFEPFDGWQALAKWEQGTLGPVGAMKLFEWLHTMPQLVAILDPRLRAEYLGLLNAGTLVATKH